MPQKDLSFKTALKRDKPSKPLTVLKDLKLLKGDLLDYGCGQGFDAGYFEMDKYDPYYSPDHPKSKYDTITCVYVLNVLHPNKEKDVLNDIKSLLKKSGVAYIAVRRDVKSDTYTDKGTFQRNVLLPLPVIFENPWCCIYKLKKE